MVKFNVRSSMCSLSIPCLKFMGLLIMSPYQQPTELVDLRNVMFLYPHFKKDVFLSRSSFDVDIFHSHFMRQVFYEGFFTFNIPFHIDMKISYNLISSILFMYNVILILTRANCWISTCQKTLILLPMVLWEVNNVRVGTGDNRNHSEDTLVDKVSLTLQYSPF